MRKRIKNFFQDEEKSEKQNLSCQEEKEEYLKLLINDLKNEPQVMPKYSVWSEMVSKCLSEKKQEH